MSVYIKCNNGKKIKCSNVNLEQEDNFYSLTVEVPIRYLNYFNSNRTPVSLNVSRFIFLGKELIKFDDSILPAYYIKDNKLFLAFEVFI